MYVSLDAYIEDSQPTISKMYGYKELIKDTMFDKKVPKKMSDSLIAKNLLSNYYGNIVECALCRHFRAYCQAASPYYSEGL